MGLDAEGQVAEHGESLEVQLGVDGLEVTLHEEHSIQEGLFLDERDVLSEEGVEGSVVGRHVVFFLQEG